MQQNTGHQHLALGLGRRGVAHLGAEARDVALQLVDLALLLLVLLLIIQHANMHLYMQYIYMQYTCYTQYMQYTCNIHVIRMHMQHA